MGDLNNALKNLEEAINKLSEMEEPLKELRSNIQKIVESQKDTAIEESEPFARYWHDIQEASDDGDAWFLDSNFDISKARICDGSIKEIYTNASYGNPYQHYVNKEYAIMAQQAKKFHDICLAWKWCYERDYTPDYKDDSYKYIILYSEYQDQFVAQVSLERHNPSLVIFENKEVADNLADWLNHHKDELDLEV